MPIKKSSLEKRWYYRVAKVFFLILPFLAAGYVYLNANISIINLLWDNIVYAAIGLVAYYLILNLTWRLLFYIVFGGLEDDTKKQARTKAQFVDQQSANQAVQPAAISPNDKKEIGFLIFMLIMIVLIYIIVSYKPSGIKLPNFGNGGTTCIPTGCGTQWYSSCTHKCYATQSDCRQTLTYEYGCASGGFCRQCP